MNSIRVNNACVKIKLLLYAMKYAKCKFMYDVQAYGKFNN